MGFVVLGIESVLFGVVKGEDKRFRFSRDVGNIRDFFGWRFESMFFWYDFFGLKF